jgi:drug/metabolite transporter (DMT)-like permease
MKVRDLASYLFLAATWGISFFVVLQAVRAFGWAGVVTFRAFIGGIVLLFIAIVARRRLDFSNGWWPLAVVGATTVAGQLVGLSFAPPRIGTAMSAILGGAAIPLFSMAIGRIWGIERLTTASTIGLLLGFAGIVMLVGFPAMPATPSFVIGCAVSLFGSLCAAIGSLYASRRLRAVAAWDVATASFVLGGLMTLPLLAVVPVPALPRLIDFIYLVVLGGVMSGMNYVLYFRLVSTIGATKSISVEFAVTAIALLIGGFLLRERFSTVQIAGTVSIVAGCILVLELVPWKRRLAKTSCPEDMLTGKDSVNIAPISGASRIG